MEPLSLPWWNLYRCPGGTSIVALVGPLSLPWQKLYRCPGGTSIVALVEPPIVALVEPLSLPWWNLYCCPGGTPYRCPGGTSIVALVEPLSLPWWNLYCCPAQGIAQRQLSGRVLCLNIFVFCKSTVDGRIHHFKPMYLARVIVYLPVAVAEKQVVKSTCTTSLMALNFASSKSQRS